MTITLAVAEKSAAARMAIRTWIAVTTCLPLTATVTTGLIAFVATAQAENAFNTSKTSGLAIHGYDLAAYFERHQA